LNDINSKYGFRFTPNERTSNILRYTISSDRIDKVSSLQTATYGGIAMQSKDNKSIYYIGGWFTQNFIQRFDIETNLTVQMEERLPTPGYGADSVSLNDGRTLIFDCRNLSILEFDMESETAKVVADIPFNDPTSYVSSCATIYDKEENVVWIFLTDYKKLKSPVLKFDTKNKVVMEPEEGLISGLPPLYYMPRAVLATGKSGYLIGGFGKVKENDGTYHPSNGILK
jgi:hypothetical protein